ncbi:MAG: polysaccharide pyruvyl transferase family protein [Spirochaetota bacterium]|nr:polysaccharide pyruvyl transferase family protein [Spirochaetota bacterium]
MKNCFDCFRYYKEWRQNRRLTKHLFWFRKHQGIQWIRGQNFGDYISGIVVAETARKLGLKRSNIPAGQKLLAIGSVLHFAQNGDIIWGTGINGKISRERHAFSTLDVRMVRGPMTRGFLVQKGMIVEDVFGDPALLLPTLFPGITRKTTPNKIIVLPNLNELALVKKKVPKTMRIVSPLAHWKRVVHEILTSELVLSSSLHGIILSEAFGVPVRFVMPAGGETLFKYQDYFLGTGRHLDRPPDTFMDTITDQSGVMMPAPVFNPGALLDTFPSDVFE